MPVKTREEKWTSLLGPESTVGAILQDLAVLNVETHVIGGDPNEVIVRIDTEIEQITGDIKNTISETAFTRDYGERLLAFHEAQRAAAESILERNVSALGKLIEMIDRIRKRKDDKGTVPTDPVNP